MNKVPTINIQMREIPVLCLGTVQLGLEYGVANKSGKPPLDIAHEIIGASLEAGVTHLDTAAAYGDSEEIIGDYLKDNKLSDVVITSKLFPGEYEKNNITAEIKERIEKSLKGLRQKKLDYFLLHDWEEYHLFDGKIWNELINYKEQELFDHIGASIYTPDQGVECLSDDHVEFVQLPLNILDYRWRSSDFVEQVRLMKRENADRIFIQARSVFLQGLLTSKTEKFPVVSGFEKEHLYKKLDHLTEKFSRKSWRDLAFSYVRSLDWVDNIVLGVETVEQFQENYHLCFEPALNGDQIEEIEKTFSDIPETLLNPSQWEF